MAPRSTAKHTDTSGAATGTLFTALEIATGQIKAKHTKRRWPIEFLDFMNAMIHIVLGNLSTHKPKRDAWLARHRNVHFHFTPTHASWLNQAEIWFSILARSTLKGASFTSGGRRVEWEFAAPAYALNGQLTEARTTLARRQQATSGRHDRGFQSQSASTTRLKNSTRKLGSDVGPAPSRTTTSCSVGNIARNCSLNPQAK